MTCLGGSRRAVASCFRAATLRPKASPMASDRVPDPTPPAPRRGEGGSRHRARRPNGLAAAIARQGPDNFGTRVYWDTKPTAAPTCQ